MMEKIRVKIPVALAEYLRKKTTASGLSLAITLKNLLELDQVLSKYHNLNYKIYLKGPNGDLKEVIYH